MGIRPFHWIASDTDILQQLRLVPGITKPSIHNPSCRSKRMRLGFTGIDDVNDFNTMCLQIIGNQTAMASPPYHFGAHDCGGAMAVCHFLQPCNSTGEFRCFYVVGVTANSFAVTCGAMRGLSCLSSPS